MSEASRRLCDTAPTRVFRSAFTSSLRSPIHSFSRSDVRNAPATAAPIARPIAPSTSGCRSNMSASDDCAFARVLFSGIELAEVLPRIGDTFVKPISDRIGCPRSAGS